MKPRAKPRQESLDLVARLLQEQEITCQNIIERACDLTIYQVRADEIRGPSRKPMAIAVRDAISYVLVKRLELSYNDVGGLFHRDRAAIIYAVKKLQPHMNHVNHSSAQEGLQWRIR